MHYRLIALGALLAVAGCAQAAPDNEAEEQVLMQTSREWSQAAASGNMDAVLGYFADDAVLIGEGHPPIRGRNALRSYLDESSKIPGFKISWEPIEAEVSGDMGYLIERTQVTMNGPDGRPVTQNLQAVTIWRKQPDGAWKNVVDMSTPAPPPAAEAPQAT